VSESPGRRKRTCACGRFRAHHWRHAHGV